MTPAPPSRVRSASPHGNDNKKIVRVPIGTLRQTAMDRNMEHIIVADGAGRITKVVGIPSSKSFRGCLT